MNPYKPNNYSVCTFNYFVTRQNFLVCILYKLSARQFALIQLYICKDSTALMNRFMF